MELDAISLDILVLAQGRVQHTVWWGGPLGALEKANWVAYQLHQKLQAHSSSPQDHEEMHKEVELPTRTAKTRHLFFFECRSTSGQRSYSNLENFHEVFYGTELQGKG